MDLLFSKVILIETRAQQQNEIKHIGDINNERKILKKKMNNDFKREKNTHTHMHKKHNYTSLTNK